MSQKMEDLSGTNLTMSDPESGSVEQPAVSMNEKPPKSRRSSWQEAPTSKVSSVFFSPKDVQKTVPSLPVCSIKEALERKHGKSKYAKDFEKYIEGADENGDGLVSVGELMHVIEQMHGMTQQNSSLKKLLAIGAGVVLFTILAIFGLTFVVVKLTQQLSTEGDALVSTSTGRIVDTHPSDGGGIVLDVAAFSEPVNMTFPGFGKTQECVGQVPVEAIQEHYQQFTTGGSALTLRHVDFTQENTPVVYTVIPGDNLAVTGFKFDGDAGKQVQEATEAIKQAQASGSRNLAAALRRLQQQNVQEGAKTQADYFSSLPWFHGDSSEFEEVKKERAGADANAPKDGNGEIIGKGNTVKREKNRRFLQEEEAVEDLVTVDDYMVSFADQSIVFALTKDVQVSNDFYFVCRGSTN